MYKTADSKFEICKYKVLKVLAVQGTFQGSLPFILL
jgi:hypothetical protein